MIEEEFLNSPKEYTINDVPKEINVFSVQNNNNNNNLPFLDTSYINTQVNFSNIKNIEKKSNKYIKITKNKNANKFIYFKSDSINKNIKMNQNNKYRYIDPENKMYTTNYRSPDQVIALLNQICIKNLQSKVENNKTYIYLAGYSVKDFIKSIFGNDASEFKTKIEITNQKSSENINIYSNVSTITIYIQTETHTIRLQRDGCSALEAYKVESAKIGTITNSLRYVMPSFGSTFEPTNESINLIKTFANFKSQGKTIMDFGVENKLFLIRPRVQQLVLLNINPPPGIVSVVSIKERNDPFIKKKMIFALCNYIFGFFGYTWSIDNINMLNSDPPMYEVTLSLYIYHEDGQVRKFTVSSIDKGAKKKSDISIKKSFIRALKQALILTGQIFVPPKEMNQLNKNSFFRVYKNIVQTNYFKSLETEDLNEKTKRSNEDQNNVSYDTITSKSINTPVKFVKTLTEQPLQQQQPLLQPLQQQQPLLQNQQLETEMKKRKLSEENSLNSSSINFTTNLLPPTKVVSPTKTKVVPPTKTFPTKSFNNTNVISIGKNIMKQPLGSTTPLKNNTQSIQNFSK